MNIKSVSALDYNTSKYKKLNQKTNFNGINIAGKKAIKGISLAALLGMTAVLGCKQPTTPIEPLVIEEPVPDSEETTETEETTEVTDTENTETQDTPANIKDTEETENTETQDVPANIKDTEETENTESAENIENKEDVNEDTSIEETYIEEPTQVNITRTEQAELFQDSTVKEMFNLLEINTKTQTVDLKEGAYTPYSGDILHVEYQISPSTKQVYDLIPEESTPDKLVYKNSIVYITAPENAYSYKSTFEKTDNGDIIRKDSLAPGYYYKYAIVDDSIKITTMNAENNKEYYRETIYYKKGRDSSEILKSGYLGLYNYYKNASVIIAE